MPGATAFGTVAGAAGDRQEHLALPTEAERRGYEDAHQMGRAERNSLFRCGNGKYCTWVRKATDRRVERPVACGPSQGLAHHLAVAIRLVWFWREES